MISRVTLDIEHFLLIYLYFSIGSIFIYENIDESEENINSIVLMSIGEVQDQHYLGNGDWFWNSKELKNSFKSIDFKFRIHSILIMNNL